MTYNVGVQIIGQPLDIDEPDEPTQLMIIRLNDTFKNVNTFPKIFFKRLPQKTIIPCTALGFGLVGRDLQRSAVTDLVKPVSININVEYNFEKCFNRFT